MRYATDNRVVQSVYAVISGPWRFAFYGVVGIVVALSIYLPVRDLYAAYRTGDILERQLAVRTEYNEGLESKVDSLLSTEGIEEAARKNLGLVMPGEHAVEVIGLDDESDASTDSASAPEASDSSSDASASEEGGSAGQSDGADSAQEDGGGASSADAAGSGSQGASGSEGESEPASSAEVEAAERAVADDVPWFIKVLDAFFFYRGVEGQTVSSTGSK